MLTQQTGVEHAVGVRSLEHEVEDVALEVQGALPAWLTGSLVRTGPARFEVGDRSFAHWFDGLAMLHRFAFAGGEVAYSNRFLHSQAFRHAEERGEIGYSEFATDPCRSIFRRVQAAFSPKLTDNASVNVVRLGDETIALTETTMPIAFDADTLSTLGVTGWAKEIPGQISIAHPHYDFATGEMLSYAAHLGPRSRYRLYAVRPGGAVRVVGEAPVDRPAYMHSFGMSERYLILAEFPLVVNPLTLLLSGKPFMANFAWAPERGLVFHVIDKDRERETRRIRAEPAFAFHHVNAFEEGDELVVDMVAHRDGGIMDKLSLTSLLSGEPVDATGALTRTRLNLRTGEARSAVVNPISFELPRIAYERVAGRRHRYAWGVGNSAPASFLDRIVKIDCDRGEAATWAEAGCYPGEPVFVGEPGAEAEDEGVLLSVVLDANRGDSFLLVLDARSLEERARARAPHHIPFGFHGNFLASHGAPPGLHA